jgi:hypothetical protein
MRNQKDTGDPILIFFTDSPGRSPIRLPSQDSILQPAGSVCVDVKQASSLGQRTSLVSEE